MALQEFLRWMPAAPPQALAEGAGKLAHAYAYGCLPEPEREDARRALTFLLDHPSPLVRRALAENLASAGNVAHYMVHTLANDISGVAAIMLTCSPLLTDAELVDCVAMADAFAQSAIALRPHVSPPVAAALAEVGALEALIALALNPGAELKESSIHRMIERHGHDWDLRAALLARPQLPASLRGDLACAAAVSIADGEAARAALPREKAESLTRDARERVIVTIAAETAAETRELMNYVAHLRKTGQLTAGVLLRGLLCGNRRLLEAALCELTGASMARAAKHAANSTSAGFASLYRRAGMPVNLLPVFAAGLEAAKKWSCGTPLGVRLHRPIIDSVLRACGADNDGELDPVVAALRRLEAEAAREEAQDFRRCLAPARYKPEALERGRKLAAKGEPCPAQISAGNVARGAAAAQGECFTIDLEALEADLLAA
ncbi:MAG: DUF2336 domain-containing protein [Beijerinckiaceae bacterium]|nr:DUF2336 domain-containing protein [Beijerinckiaceae bacterium]